MFTEEIYSGVERIAAEYEKKKQKSAFLEL